MTNQVGWKGAELVTLGMIASEPVDRSGPNTSEFVYVDISSVDRVSKHIADTKVVNADSAPSRAKQRLQAGDVLVSMTRPNLNAVALLTPEFDNAIGSTGFHVLRTKCASSKFLYYLVQTRDFIDSMSLVVQGALYPAVRPKDIESFTFALPPLNEQHRIVAKIEELFSELDQGIAALKTAREQLKVYRQALLKHAFEGKLTAPWRAEQQAKGKLRSVDDVLQSIKPIPRPNRWKTRSKDTIVGHSVLAVGNPGTSLPDGWRWVPMVDIARMESGHTPSRSHPEWWGGDIPWISIPDARKNHGEVIFDTNQKTNPQGLKNSAARLLPASTVCVSRTASVGYVVELGKPMATSQDFVNWTPSEAVLSDWLRLVFGADREALLKFAKGTTHQTIYFPEWLSVHIGLPTIEEQRKIIEEIESRLSVLEQLNQTLATSLQQAEALRQSILKRAFSGRLVPQDPGDEPAAALLERIQAEKIQPTEKPKKSLSRSKRNE